MLDDLINDPRFRRLFPPVAALLMTVLFVSLGLWQIDRAGQKNRTRALFASEAPYAGLAAAETLGEYENFMAEGRYDNERQVLIDNAIENGRIGYFVLTPFRPAAGRRWLIVNRGWIPRPAAGERLEDIGLAANDRSVRGRIGRLPRIGARSGPAFPEDGGWPKKGRYPTLDELAAALGEELYPFVMLLDPADEDGFLRAWEPGGSGPLMHYSYALQWFAMAGGTLALLAWHLRRKRRAKPAAGGA